MTEPAEGGGVGPALEEKQAVGGRGTERRHGHGGLAHWVTDGGTLLGGHMGSQVDIRRAPDVEHYMGRRRGKGRAQKSPG